MKVATEFKALCWNLPGRNEDNHVKFRRPNRYLWWNLKLVCYEYTFQALPIEPSEMNAFVLIPQIFREILLSPLCAGLNLQLFVFIMYCDF